jgi:two-component system KDP operon response regulator KdpE
MTQAMHRVLVVEDDPAIREVVRTLLESEAYRVIEAADGARAGIESRAHKPDLMLVDLGLPDGDGIEVIRAVRLWSSLPIIVLSARSLEEQKIAALDAGADDYITKPFSAPELLARVRAALRRNARGSGTPFALQIGSKRVDFATREVHGENGEVHLTPLEFRVLECLARQAGMIVRQPQLIREVWGPGHYEDSRGLRVCIRNLRMKLEDDPQRPVHIVTEAGLGYRLRTTEGAQTPSP